MNENHFDEISLRELIETLLRGKMTILIVTLVFGVLAFAGSKFLMEPTYEATAVLMPANTADQRMDASNGDDMGALLEGINAMPRFSIATYRDQILSYEVISLVMESAKLPEDITYEGFRQKINVTSDEDSNMIHITVTDTDPEYAAMLANTVKEEYMQFIDDLQKGRFEISSSFLSEQMISEKLSLEESLREHRELIATGKSSDELRSEISIHQGLLNEFKSKEVGLYDRYENQKLDKELAIKSLRAELSTVDNQLAETQQVLQVQKSFYDEPALKDTVASGFSDVTMYSEEINPMHTELTSRHTDLRIAEERVQQQLRNLDTRFEQENVLLKESIAEMEKQIEELRLALSDRQYEERLVSNKVSTAQRIYDAFLNQLESTRIEEASKVTGSQMIVISHAFVPTRSTGPRVLMNTAIGLILGMMLSVFSVFFRAYWHATESEAQIRVGLLMEEVSRTVAN